MSGTSEALIRWTARFVMVVSLLGLAAIVLTVAAWLQWPSEVLAVALTLVPVAFAGWAAKSRFLFVLGAAGTLFGLIFAPYVMWEWGPDATDRVRIVANTFSNMEGTIPGAVIGLFLGWRIGRRDNSVPTDDCGRR